MNHVVFFSGGAGSFAATKRIIEGGVDPKDLHLLFTDTMIEDRELYRFMIDALEYIYKIDLNIARELVQGLVNTEDNQSLRKEQLLEIQDLVNSRVKNMHWLRYEVDGVGIDPWDIFYNDMFIGNSRIANCSKIIKQRLARDYIRDNFDKDNTAVYLGIDWDESHRKSAPTRNWSKYVDSVNFPMCDAPYLMKDDIIKTIQLCGIRIPTPYLEGQPHLNCGSFCVRGGQGHFARLQQANPKLYEYHAAKERNLADMIREKKGTDEKYSILKQTKNGDTFSITLDDLRDQLESKKDNIDMFEIGGCGCFVTDDNPDDVDEELLAKWGMKDLRIIKYKEEIL